MNKIMTVLGARPQFIKSKPLSLILNDDRRSKEIIVHTGQHYDFNMYRVFLKELDLRCPDYYLGVNKGDNILQVSRMLYKLMPVIKKEQPDLIVVYGDTNSTLAGALAAKQMRFPLAHIEAGLRSYRIEMAEELNRVVTDRISDMLFAPVKEAVYNLKKEGIQDNVFLTGDVLYDVVLQYDDKIKDSFKILSKKLKLEASSYCFLTLHRAETVDDPQRLGQVLSAISNIKNKVVFAVHPRTLKKIREFSLERFLDKITCIDPSSYIETLALIKNAHVVLTDSGGVQREAYMLKVPCLTLRNETEWNLTLKHGWNRLTKLQKGSLERLHHLVATTIRPQKYEHVFGDGKASDRIFKIIKNYLFRK